MTRRATIRTAHADPEAVAAALAPDNTDEMETRVERVDGDRVAGAPADDADETTDDAPTDEGEAAGDGAPDEDGRRVVVTEIERESTSGLQATVDDTLVNLAVADAVAAQARNRDETAPELTEAASTDDRQQTDTNDTS